MTFSIAAWALQADHLLLRLLVIDQQIDPLMGRQRADHSHPNFTDFFQIGRPGFLVVRPGKPGGAMRAHSAGIE